LLDENHSRIAPSSPGGVLVDLLRDTGRVAQIVVATDPPEARSRRFRLRIAWCWMAGTGLGLVLIGSFLPWVISGSVKRSIYAIVGVVDRLGIAGDGVLAALLANFPLLAALCFVPVVAAALRWWRVAGVLSVLIGLTATALSLGVLALALGRVGLTVRLDPLGPTVMASGGLLLIGGGLCLIFGHNSPIRRRVGRSPAVNQS
jgi:hypothetical protein